MAFFRTAVVFLTLDRFLLLSGEHEDDRDTLCMVVGSRGTAALDVSDHSLLHCSSSSSPSEEEEGVYFSLSPAILSFHFFINSSLSVCVL